MRHLKRCVIVLLLTMVISAPSVQSAFATNPTRQGVTYYTSNDTYPSYLHLLTPSDQALVEKAQADIERYRKSNVAITVVDENGRPLEGVEVAFNQTDHNFLFGFQDRDPFLFDSARMMKEAGSNLFVSAVYWNDAEPLPGTYKWNQLRRQSLQDIQSMGFKIKVHPVVYHAPWNIPPFLRTLGPAKIENETLTFVPLLLEKIPYAEIYELSNEANWQEHGRAGLTIDQYINMLKQAASMIRAVQPNATLVVNTWDAFGEGGLTEYDYPDMSPYDWYRLLISRGLDFEVVGVQFRPGYYATEPENVLMNLAPELTQVSHAFDHLATLDKRIHITEFELPSRQLPEMKRYGNRDWNDTIQAAYVEGFYTLIFSKPTADSLVWWFIDTGLACFDDNNGPLPFEKTGSRLVPKQSYYMLKKMITNQWSTRGRGYTDTGGSLSFRGFGGTYLLTISANGLTKSVSIRVGDGTEAFQKITFDKNEALPEEQTATVKPRVDAQNILQELYQAGNWSETMSKVRSGKILQAISSLKHLYDDGEYALVIEQGRVLLENPFQINMSGRPSEFNGFAPLFVDPEGDTVIGSPPGTDLGAVYAFADSSNLYLGIVVIGDHPSKNATYTAVIQVDLGTFYVVLRNGSYAVHQPNHLTECSCWQEPWENGNIWFGCAHAVDDIVEIRVPLLQLGSPRRILLTGLWVWRDLTVPLDRYDGYDGPRVDIPNLRSFNATSILGIETTTAAASTVTPSTEPTASGFQGSLSYIAVTCGLVILGVAAVYIKTLRSRRRNLRDA